jgi:hypothetical protein
MERLGFTGAGTIATTLARAGWRRARETVRRYRHRPPVRPLSDAHRLSKVSLRVFQKHSIRATRRFVSSSGSSHKSPVARSVPKGWSRSKKSRGAAGRSIREREVVMAAIAEAAPSRGIAATCTALGVARGTYYRRRRPKTPRSRRASPRALTSGETSHVLALLHEPRFVNLATPQVYATLLDEGQYLCSLRTMYRILAANAEVRERRDQPSPRLRQARAAGRGSRSGVELGHHEAPGAREVDVLLPLRDPRHLQPVRGGLDGGEQGVRPAGRGADRHHLCSPRYRTGSAHAARGPRLQVKGCFWHAHFYLGGRIPPGKYWHAKLARNRARDRRNERRLRALGWRVRTVWECRVRRWTPGGLEAQLLRLLGTGGAARAGKRGR